MTNGAFKLDLGSQPARVPNIPWLGGVLCCPSGRFGRFRPSPAPLVQNSTKISPKKFCKPAGKAITKNNRKQQQNLFPPNEAPRATLRNIHRIPPTFRRVSQNQNQIFCPIQRFNNSTNTNPPIRFPHPLVKTLRGKFRNFFKFFMGRSRDKKGPKWP